MMGKLARLVRIRWVDASSGDEGWMDMSDFKLPDQRCLSVGWVVCEDDKQITLCATRGEYEDDINGTITIPKPWIGEIQPLSVLP
ncbi:MAG: hypothetical protein V3S83_12555 [Gemmatimonadota bacterium]